MVKFRFFVHCDGWKDGGYENAHFANSAEEALEIVENWNKRYRNHTELISITEITEEEFAKDFIGYL